MDRSRRNRKSDSFNRFDVQDLTSAIDLYDSRYPQRKGLSLGKGLTDFDQNNNNNDDDDDILAAHLYGSKAKDSKKHKNDKKYAKHKKHDEDPAATRLSYLSDRSTRIDKRWNVFRSIPRNTDIFEPRWSLLAVQVLKMFLYIILHALTLGSGILSKLSILLMTSNIRPNVFYDTCVKTGQKTFSLRRPQKLPAHFIAWFHWALWLAFCLPHILLFLRACRVTFFKSVAKPSLRVLLISIFLDVCQTFGVCLLAFEVLPKLDCWRACAALSFGLATWPSILNFCMRIRFWHDDNVTGGSKLLKLVWDFLAMFGQIMGLFIWPWADPTMKSELRITLPVALFFSSVAFWENYTTKSNVDSPSIFSIINKFKEKVRRSRYKIILVTVPTKIVLSLIFMCVIGMKNHTSGTIFTFKNLFEKIGRQRSLPFETTVFIWTFVVHVVSSFLCFRCAKFAYKVKMDFFSVALPMAMSGPICLAILAAFCEEKRMQPCYFISFLSDNFFWNCNYGREFVSNLINQRLGWAAIFWIFSYYWIIWHIFSQKIGRLNRTDTIFVVPMYDGFLLDQSLTLNRRRQNWHQKNFNDINDDFINDDALAITDSASSSDASSAYSMTSLSMTNASADATPKIYICATMWHETVIEMMQMLKSILKMDEDQSARRNAQKYLKVVDADYYELEAHVFFDDAWDYDDNLKTRVPNYYVKQFVEAIEKAASSLHKVNKILKPPVKIDVPYGGRLVWTLPGDNRLFVHLKDKTKVRIKKRWSQVMYMYYLFGHRIMEMVSDVHRKQMIADNTYLLTIDGDSKFDPSSVQKLIDLMKKHSRLGSACGRIHPIGTGMMVLYQKFEYAIAHWFQKAAEHVFGCVLCSPGCFSMFRASALMDDNVMQKYTKMPVEPRHFVQYDQGEDRWLSTLLLKQGYRIEYAAAADAETYAPETFDEFFNQRRRWTPSSVANTLDLLADYKRAVQNNDSISRCYVFYQMLVIVFSMLGPGIIFSMLVFAQVAAFRIHSRMIILTNLFPIVIFCVLCFVCSSKVQLACAKLLSVIYAFIMMAVMVGTGIQITTEGAGSPISLFVFLMTSIFSFAAFFHPKEFHNIFNGVIFFLMIPCTYLLMSLYSMINLNVVNWGTREAAQKAMGSNVTETAVQKWIRKFKNKAGDFSGFGDLSNYRSSPPDAVVVTSDRNNARAFCGCSNLFECFLCPDQPKPHDFKDEKLAWIGGRLERVHEKLDMMTSVCTDDGANPRTQPMLMLTKPTPGRDFEKVQLAKLSPEKLAPPDRKRRKSIDKTTTHEKSPNDHLHRHHHHHHQHHNNNNNNNNHRSTASSCSSDETDKDFSDLSADTAEEFREEGSPSLSQAPRWMQLDYLRDFPHDILDEMEHQFWTDCIEEHLKPIKKTVDDETRIAKSLIVYRNHIAFALLMANSLLVLALYLLQMNKDIVSIKFSPTANYTIIKWDDSKGGFKESQEPLKVETFGLIIIICLAGILLIQTLGMLLHRWQTMQHVLASTILPWFRKNRSQLDDGQELLEGNAVEIAKRLQKLSDDDNQGNPSRASKKNKHKIVFKLERARKQKQRSKCLQAAFQKRFFSFNPDKHKKSLKGIPFDKDNALFQSDSSRKAAAVELRRRRDNALQLDASDLERKMSAGLIVPPVPRLEDLKSKKLGLQTHLTQRLVPPTKLAFDTDSDQSTTNEIDLMANNNGNATGNANNDNNSNNVVDKNQGNTNGSLNQSKTSANNSNPAKSVSFMEDLERVLKNRRSLGPEDDVQ